MLRSMTGFGRGEYNDGKRMITVEIKSVNHRYSDIQVRMPRRFSFCEDAIRNAIKERVSRGKIDVQVSSENIAESDIRVELNEPLADQYIKNLTEMKEKYGLTGDISVELVATMPEVLKQVPELSDEDEIRESIVSATIAAADKLNEMRKLEGEKLVKDLLGRKDLIAGYVKDIEEKAKEVPLMYREKLKARLDELMDGQAEIPEERLAQEVAIFADKADITEEITRLRSHIDQLGVILSDGKGADGKKLDFLVQEMNREANTIGSKANDLGVTETMLKVKAEVEKIREQIQNIE